ncbi:MAG: 2-oxo acid dehydrogenase subunit E2 [Robiginitomaculum sp.]|nr:2-oxo acid dehydrogenase subunit E2 [Robiginitomaculum sp.]
MTGLATDEGITVVPLRGVRAMIADKMSNSLKEAAQLTHHAECSLSSLNSRKAHLLSNGIKVSVEDLFIEAAVKTLQRYPDMNGVIKDKQINLFKPVHLSVAMALPGNLLVAPAIFDAHKLSLEELRQSRQDLSSRAKQNKLTVTEMTGGTFSISNLGLSRVHHFTPILNNPQIGILGIGCAREKAVRGGDGSVEFVPYTGLSLTFDHRAIDGAPAAEFLTDLCREIERNEE